MGTIGQKSPPAEPEAKPVRTEGQRLLQLVTGSLQTIGESIGATKQAVALWRDGARTPEEKWRRKLHALFDIPPDAWDRAPGEASSVDTDDDDGRDISALEDVNRLIRLLREQLRRPGILARERVQLADAFARALAQKERLERAREMSEDRTIREHPKWQRLKATIIEALLPHPEAARAVEAAILRVLGEEESDAGDDVP